MPVPVKPFTFAASTTILSAQVNSDFDTLYSVFSANIDSTNVHPTRGIGANYIVSSGSGATGAFAPGAFSMTPGAIGQVPFSIVGLASQTADLFDVSTNTTKSFWIDASGAAHFAAAITLSGAAGTASVPYISASGSPLGVDFNVPTGSTTGFRFLVNNTGPVAAITAGGGFSAATGVFSGALTVASLAIAGQAGAGVTLGGDGVNTLLHAETASGAVYLSNAANTVSNAHFPDGGGFIVDRGAVGAAGINFQNNSSNVVTQNFIGDDGSGTHGININVPTGSTYGVRMLVNGGANGIAFTPSGQVVATSDGNGGHQGFVPPVYTLTGAATVGTMHAAIGNVTATGATITVTLTGAAVFANTNYFVCCQDDTGGGYIGVNIVSGSSFQIQANSNGRAQTVFAFGV